MNYKIISGKYETGTEEQQQSYCGLFGAENIQYKFDLYFHWFNLVHEVGHCLVASSRVTMDAVTEELFANRFAVSYWREADGSGNLKNLQDILSGIISAMPNPIPDDKDFKSFFSEQWGSEMMQTVQMYGYFQLSCVLEAMKNSESLADVLSEISIDISSTDGISSYDGNVSSANANEVLTLCMNNLKAVGVPTDDIHVELELVENPEIQCAKIVEEEKTVEAKTKDKILSAAIICISVTVIVLSVIQLLGIWHSSLNITVPLLGLLSLLQAMQLWNKSKKIAIFSLCVGIFVFVIGILILFF